MIHAIIIPCIQSCVPLVSLPFPKHVTKLLQRTPNQLCLLPQIRCQETVGVTDCDERSFEGILQGLGRSSRRGVGVFDTSKLQQAFDGW